MEEYLTFIWTNGETLRADSVQVLNPDTMATIEALACGDLPPAWRGDEMRPESGEGYSTPTRLKPWLRWFKQAVNFFHTHQQSVLALAPVRIDSIWLPALQRPKALLYSFRHSISVNSGIPLGKISLVVLPSKSQTREPKPPAPGTNGIPAEDLLGAIVLSGLFLSNAGWSVDSCTITEQDVPSLSTPSDPVTLPGRYQPLPPLTLHATAQFRFGPEGLMLPSSASTAREDSRPLPSQTATNLGFYRCPLYKCPAQLARLENPFEYVFLPIPVDQNAGTMADQGAALFLLEPQF